MAKILNTSILTVYDADGTPIPIPSVKGRDGTDGKSAYELYAEGGGTLTETQWLASLAQGAPSFANNISECTDTSKLYVLPDGYIYNYGLRHDEIFTNVLAQVGYTENMRISSSGVMVSWEGGADITGYIPCKAGDVIRMKNITMPGYWQSGYWGNQAAGYDANKKYIRSVSLFPDGQNSHLPLELVIENENVVQFTVAASKFGENVAYIVINAGDINATSEVYVGSTVINEYAWASTGLTYTPSDNETRIVALENEVQDHETRISALEAGDGISLPSYWRSYMPDRADTICQAMETAGANKSAFLWYTDAHWANGSAKRSPAVLRYLLENTPMNKINFGGDIVGDPTAFTHEQIRYVYEWRRMIAGLANHHSVIGNHDNNHGSGNVDNIVYAFLLAPEESSDMVKGGDFYYYIDNPCEKTRYFYLDSGKYSLSDAETKFIIDALTSLPAGWHAVIISHVWFQYTAASAPTVGSMNPYMQKALNLFDAYNARQSGTVTMKDTAQSYDFSGCGGKVEFCIGGHIHTDYDLTSTGGIPVILTSPDSNQPRGGESYQMGTVTEACVYGIVTDYGAGKVQVIHVGRGTDREITY